VSADLMRARASLDVCAEHKSQKSNSIWLDNAPLNHFVYQFAKVFALCAQKDWSHATRFREFVLHEDLLFFGEMEILKGIQRVKGSRNAALAMVRAVKRKLCPLSTRAVRAKLTQLHRQPNVRRTASASCATGTA
jgi:hypothetical protein